VGWPGKKRQSFLQTDPSWRAGRVIAESVVPTSNEIQRLQPNIELLAAAFG
jgi:hypothetical protein